MKHTLLSLRVSALALCVAGAAGLAGCSAAEATSQATEVNGAGGESAGNAAASSGESTPFFVKDLGIGSELAVYAIGDDYGISVSVPENPSAEFSERNQRAAGATSLRSVYQAWTGEETLPPELEERAQLEEARLASETQNPTLEVAELPVAELENSAAKFELGTSQHAAIAAAPPGFDYVADAKAFFNAQCVKTDQRYLRQDFPNTAGFNSQFVGRYQRLALRNGSFSNTTASFTVSHPGYSITIPLGSRQSIIWFAGGDVSRAVNLVAVGGDPDRRVDVCGHWGGERLSSLTGTYFGPAFPSLQLKAKGSGFKPSDTLTVKFLHPTQGEKTLGSVGSSVAADGVYSVQSMVTQCSDLHITRAAAYGNLLVRIYGTDGRKAEKQDNGLLQSLCWPALPAN